MPAGDIPFRCTNTRGLHALQLRVGHVQLVLSKRLLALEGLLTVAGMPEFVASVPSELNSGQFLFWTVGACKVIVVVPKEAWAHAASYGADTNSGKCSLSDASLTAPASSSRGDLPQPKDFVRSSDAAQNVFSTACKAAINRSVFARCSHWAPAPTPGQVRYPGAAAAESAV